MPEGLLSIALWLWQPWWNDPVKVFGYLTRNLQIGFGGKGWETGWWSLNSKNVIYPESPCWQSSLVPCFIPKGMQMLLREGANLDKGGVLGDALGHNVQSLRGGGWQFYCGAQRRGLWLAWALLCLCSAVAQCNEDTGPQSFFKWAIFLPKTSCLMHRCLAFFTTASGGSTTSGNNACMVGLFVGPSARCKCRALVQGAGKKSY